MQLGLEVDDSEVRRALTIAAQGLANMAPLMRTIANLQLRSTQRNFANQSFDGHAWPGLAPSTQRAAWPGTTKGVAGGRRGTRNILHPTGAHILQKIHASSTADEARIECGTGWAWVHNAGAHLQNVTLPQRTFMGITNEDVDNIVQACEHYIRREVARGFR